MKRMTVSKGAGIFIGKSRQNYAADATADAVMIIIIMIIIIITIRFPTFWAVFVFH